MTILADHEIEALCSGVKPMISPFVNESIKAIEVEAPYGGPDSYSQMGGYLPNVLQLKSDKYTLVKQRKILSYGLSSYGYDVRLQPIFKLFTNIHGCIVDPKNLDTRSLVDIEPIVDDTGTYVILPPNSYLLAPTIEYFNVPRDVMIVAVGKSTLARSGLLINVTPIEAGFEGEVVIEIANSTGLPIKVYANEGIAQFLFYKGNPCHTNYGDRHGKYQGQKGITLPKV